MKNSLRRQAAMLAILGILATGLVLFLQLYRQHYENRLSLIDALHEQVAIPISFARTNYRILPAESDPSTVNQEVLAPLNNVRALLQDLYDGKSNDLEPLVQGAEDAKILVKLSLVEVDRTIAEVTAKNQSVDFQKALTELDNLVNHFTRQTTSEHNLITVLSWFSVALLVFLFSGIVIWNYVGDRDRWIESETIRKQLTQETSRVSTLSTFIEAMASGNYSIELDNNKNDELSSTLVTMRDKLKANADEDQRRNWATSGLAQIGEILRATNRTSSDLYDNIIRFVVKYTKSNQGGLFILNDDDSNRPFLELVACYAFERKKFLNRQVEPGQGLIGQCFLERERIHLREVPSDYIRITSGLGGENPSSCLLVPLKVNEKIYGVLELASFAHYADFEVDLVEKLAETIAATISSVKINESTRLLLERTQQQAEEMKSQEEEMRQNMEELSATQEEMQRKEREYIQRIQDLEAQAGLVPK